MALQSSRDVVVAALGLMSTSLRAESEDSALDAVRADVAVLSREDLIKIACALAVDVPWRRVPAVHREKLRQRVEHALLELTWAGS